MKKTITWALVLVMTVTISGFLPGTASKSYGQTTLATEALNGFVVPVVSQVTVPDGYTGIYTKEDLDNVRNDLTGNYILMNEIVFDSSDFQLGGTYYNGGAGWIPIGSSNVTNAFTGDFDGNGYVISGLTITADNATASSAGLFGYCYDGTVKNLGMEKAYISTDSQYVGGIAGLLDSNLDNCYFDGDIYASEGADFVGGIAGALGRDIINCNSSAYINVEGATAGGIVGETNVSEIGSNVINCHNESLIVGVSSILGGISGDAFESDISGCSNTGKITISGNSGHIGGIIGVVMQSHVHACYNAGTVQANTDHWANAGGIVGASGDASIRDCFNTGKIIATANENGGTANAGGIVGNGYMDDYDGMIHCYSTGAVSASAAESHAGPILGNDVYGNYPGFFTVESCYYWQGIPSNGIGVPCKEAALQKQSTYIGFNFTSTWRMDTNLKRPVLRNNEPITYNITYTLNGGTLPSTAKSYYMSGSNLLLPTPAKAGNAFLGWTVMADPTSSDTRYTAIPSSSTGDKKYYASYGAPLLAVTSASYNSIKVSWLAAGNATSYKIYRATSGSGTYSLVKTATSTSTSWTDTGRVTGKNYYYKIHPVAGGTTYKFSGYMYDNAIPSTPAMTIGKASSTSVKISWSGVAGATKYLVYRATSPTSSTFSLAYTGSSTSRSWTDKGRTSGKTYYYKIRVYHLEGTTKVYSTYTKPKLLTL